MELLAEKPADGAYVAVMLVWLPTDSVFTTTDAVPEPFSGKLAAPIALPLSKNVTVPVGVAAGTGVFVTVAVKVIAAP